jgi:hypothetical protein
MQLQAEKRLGKPVCTQEFSMPGQVNGRAMQNKIDFEPYVREVASGNDKTEGPNQMAG